MIEQHRIHMITTAAGPAGVYAAGVAYLVDAPLARALVACGAARYLEEPPVELATDPLVGLETADAPRTRRRK